MLLSTPSTDVGSMPSLINGRHRSAGHDRLAHDGVLPECDATLRINPGLVAAVEPLLRKNWIYARMSYCAIFAELWHDEQPIA